jgi:hypothetical protein
MASKEQRNKRKSMPKQDAIYNYWKNKIELYENEKCCFACGRKGLLHRCHIMPCNSENDNNLDNIHLLCPACHSETEGIGKISLELYFEIIIRKEYWLSSRLKMLNDIAKEDVNKLALIQNQLQNCVI